MKLGQAAEKGFEKEREVVWLMATILALACTIFSFLLVARRVLAVARTALVVRLPAFIKVFI